MPQHSPTRCNRAISNSTYSDGQSTSPLFSPSFPKIDSESRLSVPSWVLGCTVSPLDLFGICTGGGRCAGLILRLKPPHPPPGVFLFSPSKNSPAFFSPPRGGDASARRTARTVRPKRR